MIGFNVPFKLNLRAVLKEVAACWDNLPLQAQNTLDGFKMAFKSTPSNWQLSTGSNGAMITCPSIDITAFLKNIATKRKQVGSQTKPTAK